MYETIDYTDEFIYWVNEDSQKDHINDLYYDMIDAIEDGYTMEVE
jgi:hypothetical protein